MNTTIRIPANGTNAFMVQQWQERPIRQISAQLAWSNSDSRRIGIIGSHGVGKSTFSKMLADELEITLIEEIARTLHNLGFKLDLNANMNTTMAAWIGQFYEEIKHKDFVSDRTLIDPLVYATARHNRSMGDSQEKYMLTALGNITHDLMPNQYSDIFYIPIEFGLIDDGVRATDNAYQQEVDQLILSYLESFGVEYVTITGSKQERIETALSYLKQR